MKPRCPGCRKKLDLNRNSCIYCGHLLSGVHIFKNSDQAKLKEIKGIVALSFAMSLFVLSYPSGWFFNDSLVLNEFVVRKMPAFGFATLGILFLVLIHLRLYFQSFTYSDSVLVYTTFLTYKELSLEGACLVQSPVDRKGRNYLLVTRKGEFKIDNSIVDCTELIHLLKSHAKITTKADYGYINIDATDIIPFDCHPSKTYRLGLQIIPLGALFFLVLGIGVTINEGLSISTGLLSSLAILILAIWLYSNVILKVTVGVEGITYYKLFRTILLPYSEIQSIRWKCNYFKLDGLLITGNGKRLGIPDDYEGFRPLVESLRKYARIEDDSDTVDIPLKYRFNPLFYWLSALTNPAVFLGIEIYGIYLLFFILDEVYEYQFDFFEFQNVFYFLLICILILQFIAFCLYLFMRKLVPISIEFGLSEIILTRGLGKSTVIPVDALEQIELVKINSRVFLKIVGAGNTISISSIYGVNMHFLHDALVRCYAKTQTESE